MAILDLQDYCIIVMMNPDLFLINPPNELENRHFHLLNISTSS